MPSASLEAKSVCTPHTTHHRDFSDHCPMEGLAPETLKGGLAEMARSTNQPTFYLEKLSESIALELFVVFVVGVMDRGSSKLLSSGGGVSVDFRRAGSFSLGQADCVFRNKRFFSVSFGIFRRGSGSRFFSLF